MENSSKSDDILRSLCQSFVQVVFNGVQEVSCVDVVFVQLDTIYTYIYIFLNVIIGTINKVYQHALLKESKNSNSLSQAVDAACKVFGHHSALHRFHTHLL